MNRYERNAAAIAQAVATGSREVKANQILMVDHIVCNTCDGAGLFRGEVCPECGGHGVTVVQLPCTCQVGMPVNRNCLKHGFAKVAQ